MPVATTADLFDAQITRRMRMFGVAANATWPERRRLWDRLAAAGRTLADLGDGS